VLPNFAFDRSKLASAARPGGGPASTSQGHAGKIFRRALERDNLVLAEATSREIGRIILDAADRASGTAPTLRQRLPSRRLNGSAVERREKMMRRSVLIAAVVAVMASVGAGVARADKPPVELAGQPFYFSATCTGIGDVFLVNQSLAKKPALRVVGTQTVVLPFPDKQGPQPTDTCTFTGGGFSIETITPFEEPFSLPALIV